MEHTSYIHMKTKDSNTFCYYVSKYYGFYTNYGFKGLTYNHICQVSHTATMWHEFACMFLPSHEGKDMIFKFRRKYLGNHHAINDCISSHVSNYSMVDPFNNPLFTFCKDQSIHLCNSVIPKKLSICLSKWGDPSLCIDRYLRN